MCQCATIDDYFDFYNFVKLRDGRIAIQLMMGSDGADYVFNPYTEEVADGDGKVKAKDIDNSLYHSHMLYLGEIENKMPLPTKQVYESNASTNTKDQTIDILNFADNYLGKTVNSSNHADLTDQEEDFLNQDVVLFGVTGRYHLGASSSQTGDRIVDDLRWESSDVVTDYEGFLNCLMEIYGDTYDEDYIIISIEDSDETYTWIATEKYNYVTCWQNSDGTVTLHWMI